MQSLIIPLAILLLVGTWGVWETGRKFRAEFRRRGKAWESVCADMARGAGILVVDTLWGPQRGLGHPVIWWLPVAVEAEQMAMHIEGGSARLVRCPRRMRNAASLSGLFGSERVRTHTWAVGSALAGAGEAR